MSSDRWATPITLTGSLISLVPTDHAHANGLAEAAGNLSELWCTFVPKPENITAEIDMRLGQRDTGMMVPFTVIRNSDQTPIGMTTYCNIDHKNERLEIGYTWYAKSVQRTGVNTEAKFLLLTHAFETLGAVAVEFRTHCLNTQSRRAIERLGAKQDGILRNHVKMANGTRRDTAVYSICDYDWPPVKAGLTWQMTRYA